MPASSAERRVEAPRGKLRGIGVSNTVASTNVGPDRARRAALRSDRHADDRDGHAGPRPGPCHLVPADHRRQARRSRPSACASVQGDTDLVAIGTGTFGSRSMVAGGTALLMAADKIIAKGKRLAAHLMEADEHDIVFEQGRFIVAGTDKTIDAGRDRARLRSRPRACRRAWSPACSRPEPSTAASAPSRTAATSSRSRSTRRPARSRSCATTRSRMSVT